MRENIREANILYRKGDFASALKKYEEIVNTTPELKNSLELNINLARKKCTYNLKYEASPAQEEVCELLINTHNELEPSLLDAIYDKRLMKLDYEGVFHKDLISVIMPSYNNENYIKRAIHSVLSQVGVSLELIIIDDGSTDASVQIAKEIEENHSNVKVISLLKNFGCYYARNIGLTYARGKWVTIVDSDDIISPKRLKIQLDYLEKNPELLGCRCQQRRWAENYEYPMSELKAGENSLVWKRDLIDKIGFYDSVRYSGDAEFRLRIQRSFGTDSIIVIPEELYYTRTVAGSLTTNERSKVFIIENNKIEVELSPQRKKYFENFTNWQKSNKKSGLKINFPLFKRDFKMGAEEQSAAPHLHQKIVGCMTSFPARYHALKATIKSIINQVDELRLYLNEYDSIPDFLQHEKIKVTLGRNELGDLRDNGKFYSIPNDNNTYVFTFDDDLIYPSNYVSKMIFNIEMLNRGCIVGVHGAIFPEGSFTKLTERKVFSFSKESDGVFVDLLGTGTCAWHSSTIKIELEEFKSKGVCDLWFSLIANREHIPLLCVKREAQWIVEPKKHAVSLYKEAVEAPEYYFSVFNENIKPFIKNGLVRKLTEIHYLSGFDGATLNAAGFAFYERNEKFKSKFLLKSRKNISYKCAKTKKEIFDFYPLLKFSIIVNGWNCSKYIDNALRSIANLQPGPFSYEVIIVDDGSDDGGFEKLVTANILPGARVIRVSENAGPAYARHIGICSITNKDNIVVLLDMDDELDRTALRVVADRYLRNKKCLMTIGNWIDQNGKINPQSFYTQEEIDGQATRLVDLFNATHLRTFKRALYDSITDDDLKDQEGNWLETCTDVAIMYPLMDQCWFDEIEFIAEPIYHYTRQHGNGTLARFGKPHKIQRLAWLKGKSPKQRFRN